MQLLREKIPFYVYKNNLSATYFEFRAINAYKEIVPGQISAYSERYS
jgi:hypothetical protein